MDLEAQKQLEEDAMFDEIQQTESKLKEINSQEFQQEKQKQQDLMELLGKKANQDIDNPPTNIKVNDKKKQQQYKIEILGIEIYFPFKPYQQQLDYMKKVIESLNNKNNALMQSPTGTGKTLCMLCATMGWLKKKREEQIQNKEKKAINIIYSSRTHSQLKQVIRELKKTIYKPKTCVLSSRDQSCINPQLQYYSRLMKNTQCRKACKENTCSYYAKLKNQEKGIQTSYKQNMDKLVKNEDEIIQENDEQIDEENEEEVLKKIKQNFSKQYIEKSNIMDIEDLKEMGQRQNICPYYYSLMAKDFADIIFMPYNYLLNPNTLSLEAIPIENAVILFDEAHNVLEVSEEGSSYPLESQHLVSAIEELSNIKSRNIKLGMVEEFIFQFQNYTQQLMQNKNEIKKMDDNNYGFVKPGREILSFFKKNFDFNVNGKREEQQKNYDYLNKKKYDNQFDREEYSKLKGKEKGNYWKNKYQNKNNKKKEENVIQGQQSLAKFGFFQVNKNSADKNQNISPQKQEQSVRQKFSTEMLKTYCIQLSRCIEMLKISKDWGTDNWAIFMNGVLNLFIAQDAYDNLRDKSKSQNLVDNYRFVFKKVKNESTNEYEFNINLMCLDPAISFQKITNNNPYNIILTSGTLSPFNFWDAELKMPFKVKHSGGHIIDGQKQLNAGIVRQGKQNTQFQFSYKNREDDNMFIQLGNSILEISKKVPQGVLVVFGSYNVRDKCKEIWIKNKIYWQLNQEKQIFIEPNSGQDDTAIIMEKYKKVIEKGKGAILLCISKGKLSEGYDFPDGMCRAVIMIGIPFPPVKDIKIKEKKQHLNDMKSSITGQSWYLMQAIRAINQAIGRVIRHINDYGSIYLFDSRFGFSDTKAQISGWIREQLKDWNNFDIVIGDTVNFFDYHKQPTQLNNILQQQKEKQQNYLQEFEEDSEQQEQQNYEDKLMQQENSLNFADKIIQKMQQKQSSKNTQQQQQQKIQKQEKSQAMQIEDQNNSNNITQKQDKILHFTPNLFQKQLQDLEKEEEELKQQLALKQQQKLDSDQKLKRKIQPSKFNQQQQQQQPQILKKIQPLKKINFHNYLNNNSPNKMQIEDQNSHIDQNIEDDDNDSDNQQFENIQNIEISDNREKNKQKNIQIKITQTPENDQQQLNQQAIGENSGSKFSLDSDFFDIDLNKNLLKEQQKQQQQNNQKNKNFSKNNQTLKVEPQQGKIRLLNKNKKNLDSILNNILGNNNDNDDDQKNNNESNKNKNLKISWKDPQQNEPEISISQLFQSEKKVMKTLYTQQKNKQQNDKDNDIDIDQKQSEQSTNNLQINNNEKQVSNTLDSQPDAMDKGKEKCCICWNYSKIMQESSHCKHRACNSCWDQWLSEKLECPMCRERVRKKYLRPVVIN